MRGIEQKNKKHAKKFQVSNLKRETLKTLIEILGITDSFSFKTHVTLVMIQSFFDMISPQKQHMKLETSNLESLRNFTRDPKSVFSYKKRRVVRIIRYNAENFVLQSLNDQGKPVRKFIFCIATSLKIVNKPLSCLLQAQKYF